MYKFDECFPLPFQPHYDVGILLTIVLAILTIVLIFAFRYKCKSNRTWVSETDIGALLYFIGLFLRDKAH